MAKTGKDAQARRERKRAEGLKKAQIARLNGHQ